MRSAAILRRGLVLLVLTAMLAVPGPSWSHERKSTSSLTGTIVRIAGGIQVTLTNTGTDSFHYVWVQMVPSVHHTGASIDRGGGCGPGPDLNTVKCGISFGGFQPNQVYVVTIMTDHDYPVEGGAQLFTGDATDGPLNPAGTATGPEAPPLPKPEQPCRCRSLTARIVSPSLGHPNGRGLDMYFGLHWTLGCTPGAGGCEGKLTILAPHQKPNPRTKEKGYVSHFKVGPLGNKRLVDSVGVACPGACANTTAGTYHLRLDSFDLGVHERALESIPIVVQRSCQGKALPPIRLTIAFDDDGRIDLPKSRLG